MKEYTTRNVEGSIENVSTDRRRVRLSDSISACPAGASRKIPVTMPRGGRHLEVILVADNSSVEDEARTTPGHTTTGGVIIGVLYRSGS